ncbi:M48 family metalloprotease [Pseudohongiella sp. SYSU M77423]|uniref:M48 family metalloprotease n=1 Tax=unclassified Pseudohongiella TaxID=2629611 RepID=UPI000C5679C5|nr:MULTISPECIES: M48 family metalloprotease [unclassified Pseudohongiella]MAY56080.1 peptidase M48 [Gammaproteobacteria bacterium]HBN14966.1 peptidase M48 [Pseudohongiella sp.]MBJ54805.1 peptidase M48 [Gammaproteobacteria bacterium]MDH7944917.1 M48 family metalloprotease [Pseudohongiella sp. SYSU M77423]HBX36816.1 peptidase M48 [Pseudohongiella sp.]|tara:strand:+ start:5562 stop:7025 length:1464 start_codon:yes stop_codon:yes gene_type:complete
MRSILKSTALSVAIALSCQSPAALAQSQLPTLGDRISGIFSLDEEYKLGRDFLRSVRRTTPTISDPLINDYVVNFTHNLAVHSDLQDYRLAFIVVDSPALNAFATPGGVIGVNGGLFLNAHTEGEFASVMAHEIAHVSQRHFARSVEDAQRRRIPELATLLASIVLMGSGSSAGPAAVMAAQGRSIENQLRFSRQNEAEADRIGLRTMVEAGYDPADMASLFERLMDMSRFSSRPPEFLLSHPVTEARIADARSRANRIPYRPSATGDTLEYHLIRARIEVHYANSPEAALEEFNKRSRSARSEQERKTATYGLALAQLKAEQYGQALESIDLLLASDPNRITYVVTRADILTQSGEPQQALDFLDRHIRINPENHPLTMTRVDALIEQRNYAEAARIMERHAINRPEDHNLWYQIAETQGQVGDISKVHQARAEYFILVGDFRSAREQLNYALRIETDREQNIPLISRLRQRLGEVERMQRELQER